MDADHRLRRIRIEGFKSIRSTEVELRPLNVLIGENGSGKSNFVEVFRLFHAIEDRLLGEYARKQRADDLLFLGAEVTDRLSFEIQLYELGYQAILYPFEPAGFLISEKASTGKDWHAVLDVGTESQLARSPGLPADDLKAFQSWTVYHFHDTSPNAKCRGFAPLHDWDRLRAEGENLAAYLYRLRNGDPDDQRAFGRIERLVGLGLPFFDRFVLEPTPGRAPGNEDVLLRWRQKGSDFPFTAQHLSDGSLRYVLLTTALNQPKSHRPTTMVIDEPELGLHPKMLGFLAGQIKSVAAGGQVVVATQSSVFLDEFEAEDIIVVDRVGAESRFRRLSTDELKVWLDDYTLSELVWKGVIGGESSVF